MGYYLFSGRPIHRNYRLISIVIVTYLLGAAGKCALIKISGDFGFVRTRRTIEREALGGLFPTRKLLSPPGLNSSILGRERRKPDQLLLLKHVVKTFIQNTYQVKLIEPIHGTTVGGLCRNL